MSIVLISQWVQSINPMKICNNCTTINKPSATSCVKCSMKGMLVEVEMKNNDESPIKVIYPTCKNCGTSDTGKGSLCMQCNFPMPKVKTTNITSDSSTSNAKVS